MKPVEEQLLSCEQHVHVSSGISRFCFSQRLRCCRNEGISLSQVITFIRCRALVSFNPWSFFFNWLVICNIFYFPFHIWDNPSHWLIFFRGVAQPPTSLKFLADLISDHLNLRCFDTTNLLKGQVGHHQPCIQAWMELNYMCNNNNSNNNDNNNKKIVIIIYIYTCIICIYTIIYI